MLDDHEYTEDRYCPVFKRVIDCEWCYESVLGLSRAVKIEAVPELNEIDDLEAARELCDKCKYSDLE